MLPFVSAPPFLHLSLSPTDFPCGSYTTARVFNNSTQPLLLEQSYISNTKYTVRRANRPIACLVWREVQPCLEAWSASIQRLHSSRETEWSVEKIWPIVFSHQQYLIATTCLAQHCFLLSCTIDTGFFFIPALTCSYLPCIYSSHVILVSLFRGFDWTPWTPLVRKWVDPNLVLEIAWIISKHMHTTQTCGKS